MMNRKAVTVQATIISIIILLISAGILFYFLKILPYQETIDKEACHQSVILRSQQIAKIRPGEVLGLGINCRTQEIEINEVNPELMKREIANAMYDCWWMLGEGKLNFFSENNWKQATNLAATSSSCMICAHIKFSDKVRSKVSTFDMTQYLSDTMIPMKNMTYMDYFVGSETEKIPTDVRMMPIDTNKEYLILYEGIRSEGFSEPLVKDAALALGGFMMFGNKENMLIQFKETAQSMKGVSLLDQIKMAGLYKDATLGTLKSAFKSTVSFFKGPLGIAVVAYALTQEAFVLQSKFAVVGQCGQWGDGCSLLIVEEATPETLTEKCGNIESIP
jgi:hypothetical protein